LSTFPRDFKEESVILAASWRIWRSGGLDGALCIKVADSLGASSRRCAMRAGIMSKVVGVVLFFGVGILPTTADGAWDPTADLLMRQGADLYQSGEMAGALASFNLAAEVDPVLAEAPLSAAQVALLMGDDTAAARYAEVALARQPGDWRAIQMQAIVRERSAVPSSADGTGGNGFAEFGLAALVGSLFIFAVSMHDIGETPPVSEGSPVEEPAMGALLPFCRTRVATGGTRETPHEWIEAA